ncbi:hypothetical protein [Acinetobacter baylyi]|uniref:hypothetical protein n=1 Tax=Acinetobacter baylyi TaxID=202950 RepID=UPI0013C45C25|nr:hypothetical protein [Acinetobacter baylyi]
MTQALIFKNIPERLFRLALINSYRSKGQGLCNLHCAHVATFYFHLDDLYMGSAQ